MNGNELLDKMELIDPKYIEEGEKSMRTLSVKRLLIYAAVITLSTVLVLSLTFAVKYKDEAPMKEKNKGIIYESEDKSSQITQEPEEQPSPLPQYGDTVPYTSLLFPEDSKDVEFSEYATQSEFTMDMDIASFHESFTEGSAFVEGRVTDIYEKRYDYTIGSTKIPSITVSHCYTVTIIYEFEITKVWSGEFDIGEKILIEDVQYSFDSQFHMKTGHKYVIPIQDTGNKIAIMSIVGEVVDGETERQSPYTTCYPYHPQIEITEDGYYFFPNEWETLASENAIKVTDAEFGEGSVYYKDKMVLLDPDTFEVKLRELISKYQ